MEFKPTIDEIRKIIILEISGTLKFINSQKIGEGGRTLSQKYNYPILYDLRNTSLDMTLSELYQLPRELDKKGFPRSPKVAMLVADNIPQETYKFYENVMVNLGMLSRIFKDKEESLEWLVEK